MLFRSGREYHVAAMPSLRRPFLTYLALAVALCVVWTSVSMRIVGELVPPLDDTFIHFTYARRLAEGHPFSYFPGEPYSSGATSLSWPILLAIGWVLGFKGGSLYLWALGLSNLALAAVATFTHRWLERLSSPRTGMLGALLVMGSGVVLWGAFSGMEVTLFMAAIAGTLDALTRPGRTPGAPAPGGLTWVAVMATVRPEGAIFAGLFALQQGVEAWIAGGRRVGALAPGKGRQRFGIQPGRRGRTGSVLLDPFKPRCKVVRHGMAHRRSSPEAESLSCSSRRASRADSRTAHNRAVRSPAEDDSASLRASTV